VACEGDDSDSSDADTHRAAPSSACTVDSDSSAAEGGSGASMTAHFFSPHFFFHLSPHVDFAFVNVCTCSVSPVLRCDTMDSDSSNAVVPETFLVAPHGFVLHCLTPCVYAVLCCTPPSLNPGRTQTVIVGGHLQRDIIQFDYFFPVHFLLSFVIPCRSACTQVRGTSLRCCVTRWIVIVIMQLKLSPKHFMPPALRKLHCLVRCAAYGAVLLLQAPSLARGTTQTVIVAACRTPISQLSALRVCLCQLR